MGKRHGVNAARHRENQRRISRIDRGTTVSLLNPPIHIGRCGFDAMNLEAMTWFCQLHRRDQRVIKEKHSPAWLIEENLAEIARQRKMKFTEMPQN